MGKNKDKKVTKKPVEKEQILFKGPRRTFRTRNPEGHMDKYNHITLTEGMVVPKELIPRIKEEEKRAEIKERIEELETDLNDDGKRNFSKDKDKKTPGRKKKK